MDTTILITTAGYSLLGTMDESVCGILEGNPPSNAA